MKSFNQILLAFLLLVGLFSCSQESANIVYLTNAEGHDITVVRDTVRIIVPTFVDRIIRDTITVTEPGTNTNTLCYPSIQWPMDAYDVSSCWLWSKLALSLDCAVKHVTVSVVGVDGAQVSVFVQPQGGELPTGWTAVNGIATGPIGPQPIQLPIDVLGFCPGETVRLRVTLNETGQILYEDYREVNP